LKPNCYRIAERNLKQQDFRTFLPMYEETMRAANRFSTGLRPLFPGYIFVALDAARGGWRSINGTLGVKELVSFGKQPAEVPDEVVRQLMLRCDSRGMLLPQEALQPGDRVRLTSGPFARFLATVEEIAPGQRVHLLLELMGRHARTVVPAGSLRRAPASTGN
jgi:transcriptional antiterminator RfaH